MDVPRRHAPRGKRPKIPTQDQLARAFNVATHAARAARNGPKNAARKPISVDAAHAASVEKTLEKRNATTEAPGGVSVTSLREAVVTLPEDSNGVQPPGGGNSLPPLATVTRIRPWTEPGRLVAVSELRDILRHHESLSGVLAFDEYRHRITVRREPPWRGGAERSWTDVDSRHLRAWVYDEFRSAASADVVEASTSIVADGCRYHSLADELRSYRQQWDQQPRVAKWLEVYCGASPSKITESLASRFLVSAIARAFSPGCKADHVLVLEGPTGSLKSTAIAALAGEEHYSDSPIDLASVRDAPVKLAGVWMQEFPEMSILSQYRPDIVKAFVSRRRDDFVPKYGRHTVNIARSCVFVGTVESGQYLTGSTNRRFWPVYICTNPATRKKIDVEGIARDRIQLLAEAVALYESGLNWWLDEDDEALIRKDQETRRDDDSWEEPITQYIVSHWISIRQRGYITIPEILEKALGIKAGVWKKKDEMRVAEILIRGKWRKGDRQRDGKGRVYPWRHESMTAPAAPAVASAVASDSDNCDAN